VLRVLPQVGGRWVGRRRYKMPSNGFAPPVLGSKHTGFLVKFSLSLPPFKRFVLVLIGKSEKKTDQCHLYWTTFSELYWLVNH
jgi:hypothetical protein